MSATYLLRFDDLCPTAKWSMWEKIEAAMDERGLRGIIAVIPDNRDESLFLEPAVPDFWERVRGLQARGWTIAMHGHQHRYVTVNAGLFGWNARSEFAGLPFEEQDEKIRQGLEAFRRAGVRADGWVAPNHSFDAATIEALRRNGIGLISDGWALRPHRDERGMVWIPAQLYDFVRRPAGVWTISLHPNKWGDAELERFLAGLDRYAQRIGSVPAVAARYGARSRGWTDAAFERQRRLKKAVARRIRPARSSAEAPQGRPTDDGSSPAELAEPVFIVGCARSGTSMLRAMLDAHPDLAIPPESHFITAVWGARKRYRSGNGIDAARLAADIVRTYRFNEWGIDPDLVHRRVGELKDPSFADVVDAVFGSYAAAHGKTRWGDKTPNYSLDVALLAAFFPRARFVHLLRDGRDVALSLMDVPWWPKRLADAAAMWSRWTGEARAAGRRLGSDRYLEVRYETFIEDPEAGLRAICAFAGLPYRAEMLADRSTASSDATPVFHRNALRPPTKGLREWTRQMPPRDVALFEAIAGDQLRALGYPTMYESLPRGATVRAGAAGLVSAVARGLRRAQVAAHLAIRREMLPPPRRW